MRTPDVVFLVPGFLGFARLGGFYYFADRVAATLRGHLEQELAARVPVIPCSTLPTINNSLADRQRFLLDYFGRIVSERLEGVERLHLVGHSTGGVDVQLLTCTRPLDGNAWGPDTKAVRDMIASVVTISAPHYGTGLANSRLARVGENPLAHPSAIPGLVAIAGDLLALIPREMVALAGLKVAVPNDVLKFLFQIVCNRDLIADLRPGTMERIRKAFVSDPRPLVTCYGTGTIPRRAGERTSDPFFVELYEFTETGAAHPSGAVREQTDLLRTAVGARPDLLIRSDQAVVPDPIDPALNDGIVNTVRQFLPPDVAEFGGLVVADHADVLGHYDRRDSLIDGPPLNEGLFHSGAGFGDDEFFALYQRVAAAVLKGRARYAGD